MDFNLTGDQVALRDTVRRFAGAMLGRRFDQSR